MPPCSSATWCSDDGANVWPGAVLRGDVERIHLGARSSFQDNSVAHSDPGFPWSRSVPTAWWATTSSCTAAPWARAALIGMGAILLNGCVVGDDCIVGAGALLTQGKMFPPRSLIVGSPAKAVREVTDDDLRARSELCDRYVRRSRDLPAAGWEPCSSNGRRPVAATVTADARAAPRQAAATGAPPPRPGPGSTPPWPHHETFFAPDRAAWRAWLAAHHASAARSGCLLLKKHVGEPCVTYDEAVEEALCFGWVDSVMQRSTTAATPCASRRASPRATGRRATGARASASAAEGRMAAAGLARGRERQAARLLAASDASAPQRNERLHVRPPCVHRLLRPHPLHLGHQPRQHLAARAPAGTSRRWRRRRRARG